MRRPGSWTELFLPAVAVAATWIGAPVLLLGSDVYGNREQVVGAYASFFALFTVALLLLVVPRLRGPHRFGAATLLAATLGVVWGAFVWMVVSGSRTPFFVAGILVILGLSGLLGEIAHRVRAIVRRGAAREVFE